MMNGNNRIELDKDDALIIVDLQNDFLPGGSLSVPDGNKIIPVFNSYIEAAQSKNLHIFATRDWHTLNHSSFNKQGGPWPQHCVADSRGAEFASNLNLPKNAEIISKATLTGQDAYSGFEGTGLDERLRSFGITRLLIGGLATDYCVLNTVKDGLELGYGVLLLLDAIRAVDVNPGDGERAIEEMKQHGALPITFEMIC